MYQLNPTTSRISLLLYESKEELRSSVNNKDILRVQVGLASIPPFDVPTLICKAFEWLKLYNLFNGPENEACSWY